MNSPKAALETLALALCEFAPEDPVPVADDDPVADVPSGIVAVPVTDADEVPLEENVAQPIKKKILNDSEATLHPAITPSEPAEMHFKSSSAV